jgi:soluble lytic murein transglycosylase-like protein
MTHAMFAALLYSVCQVESGGFAGAINWEDGGSPSYGLCQVKLGTARSFGFAGDATGLMDPVTNFRVAGRVLQYHLKRCETVEAAVGAYNTGSCHKRKRSYVKQVVTRWRRR